MQRYNKKMNKQNTKERKKNSKFGQKNYLRLLDEACCCCSKLLHLYKKVGREYQLT